MTEPGLRERSKARRRDAIERAALRLFAEHGYDPTTVPQIAAAAEVSPRTVLLYFPTKADLIMGRSDAASRRLAHALTHRDPSDPVTAVFERWLADEDTRLDPELRLLRSAMFTTNPAFLSVRSADTQAALAAGGTAIAADLGLSSDDIRVEVLLAATVGLLDGRLRAGARSPSEARAFREVAGRFLEAGMATLASPPR